MYSPKLNWIKFNEMFSNRIIEPMTSNVLDISGSKYPINIKSSYVNDDNKECSSKCSFSFKYPSSSLKLTNNSAYLELDYDNGTTSPVIFNAEKYKVHKIYILNKSLHYFEGTSAIGEILIYHISLEGALPLIVSIPISNSSSAGSTLGTSSLENVISIAYENTLKSNDSVTLNTNSFTINDYFPPPGTPFYTYKGENFLQNSHFSGENVHYIVYDHNNGVYLDQSSDSSNKLNTLITTNTILNNDNINAAETGNDDEDFKKKLFINNNGASIFEGDDDIYIDCSPTGDSDEEVAFNLKANSITGGITSQKYNFMLSVITKFSICIVIILVIWYAPYYITDMINGKDIMRKLEDMTFGGPMDEFINLEKEIKKLKKDLLGTKTDSEEHKSLEDLIQEKESTLRDKKLEMRDTYADDRRGISSAMKKGFFFDAAKKGEERKIQRDENLNNVGKERGALTNLMESKKWSNLNKGLSAPAKGTAFATKGAMGLAKGLKKVMI